MNVKYELLKLLVGKVLQFGFSVSDCVLLYVKVGIFRLTSF